VSSRNFFAELKRRNVYKVAVAYAIVGWLLVQIATQVFPFLEIPNWIVRLVIALIAIGFPIALIIAWAFELTPEGIKRTESANEPANKSSRGRVWIYVVTIGAVLSLGLFLLGRYTASRSATSSTNPASEKSIAVLPFENLSEDKANAYFADGVQEEILTRLSKIADLKVISRTSTEKYKSAPNNLREIAQQLGVANILEGSIQRSTDQVRVNVQLIKATTDAHLWADTFDRKLTDIFAVESEIATAIAEKLQAKLSGPEQSAIAARPTENREAHDLYLKGRYFFGKRTPDDFTKAIDCFYQAIAKDPNYALAYAGLADCYSLLPDYSAKSSEEYLAKAKAAANKAISLDSTLAEAHASLGLVLGFEGHLVEAKRVFERAIALNPNYAPAHYFFGTGVLLALGEFDRSIAEVKRAIELDPFSVVMNVNFGWCYVSARRYSEAIAQFRKAAELNPSGPISYVGTGVAYELSGEREKAITEYQKAYDLGQKSGAPPGAFANILAEIYVLKGEPDKALQPLEEFSALVGRGEAPAFLVALVYVALGDKDKAIEWLERSYQNKEHFLIQLINVYPSLDPLRSDPRFQALAQKVMETAK
jgi:TolB-like protein/Tfp pilus assembly protein PilF